MRQAKDYIVFPLDFPSEKEARTYVEMLSAHVGMFKVGLELFIQSGPEIVKFIKAAGAAKVFLDLKLHDIPVTVSRAMARVAEIGADFVTVHCGESREMLVAAVDGSQGRVGILAVTVLTSVSGENLRTAGFKDEYAEDLPRLVQKRAATAKTAGCTGVVCSGLETKMVKSHLGPDFITVTPGIRPAWEGVGKDDQQRVTTPAQAIQNGSDYLVIGRPIRDAAVPKAAAIRIAEEIESGLTSPTHK